MKARIRKTGEIVDVISYNIYSTIRSHQDYVSYIDSKGEEHDRESLNYYWDFEPIDTQLVFAKCFISTICTLNGRKVMT